MNYSRLILALLVVPITLMAESRAGVPTPEKRNASLIYARSLINPVVPEVVGEEVLRVNPFNPVHPVPEGEAAEKPSASLAAPVMPQDTIKEISAGVKPSGMVQLGNEPFLLFGQKRFKVGDRIPVVFQGTAYALEVRSIDRINFTLKLNNQEITLPIKPVIKKP